MSAFTALRQVASSCLWSKHSMVLVVGGMVASSQVATSAASRHELHLHFLYVLWSHLVDKECSTTLLEGGDKKWGPHQFCHILSTPEQELNKTACLDLLGHHGDFNCSDEKFVQRLSSIVFSSWFFSWAFPQSRVSLIVRQDCGCGYMELKWFRSSRLESSVRCGSIISHERDCSAGLSTTLDWRWLFPSHGTH